jgi:hypothetical protein
VANSQLCAPIQNCLWFVYANQPGPQKYRNQLEMTPRELKTIPKMLLPLMDEVDLRIRSGAEKSGEGRGRIKDVVRNAGYLRGPKINTSLL